MSDTLRPDDDELRVAGALRQLAARTRSTRPLPTAGQLWWRAEVVRRLVAKPEEETARKLRPALWGERAGIALGLAVLLGFLSLQAPAILEPLWKRMVLGGLPSVALLGLAPLAAASLLGLLFARRS
ncbi:MAG TPA: hypothetical protein VIC28_12340 [Thermoanaerobaculia bacterium]|jgi:hypothetical protein